VRRTQITRQPVRPDPRDVREGNRVRPSRRGRVHQVERPARSSQGAVATGLSFMHRT
jgi:hypothetical protein